jgi:hypothetical protein
LISQSIGVGNEDEEENEEKDKQQDSDSAYDNESASVIRLSNGMVSDESYSSDIHNGSCFVLMQGICVHSNHLFFLMPLHCHYSPF